MNIHGNGGGREVPNEDDTLKKKCEICVYKLSSNLRNHEMTKQWEEYYIENGDTPIPSQDTMKWFSYKRPRHPRKNISIVRQDQFSYTGEVAVNKWHKNTRFLSTLILLQIFRWRINFIRTTNPRRINLITPTRYNFKPYPRRKSSSPHQPKENFDTRCSMNNRDNDLDQNTEEADRWVQNAKEDIKNRSCR